MSASVRPVPKPALMLAPRTPTRESAASDLVRNARSSFERKSSAQPGSEKAEIRQKTGSIFDMFRIL